MRKLLAAVFIAAGACTAANAFVFQDLNPPKPVREYFNHYSRHYVLFSNPAEIAAVDAGAAGPGWVATGYSFNARNETLSAPNVCRFYAPAPTSAHFFTVNADECAALKGSPGLTLEGLDFSIDPPQGGTCAADRTPIYRLYNESAPVGQRSHRFIHDESTGKDMMAAGWRGEGIAFCALGAARGERQSFLVVTQQVRPSAECEDEAISVGGCVALNQIPPLTNKIVSWAPPLYDSFGPLYSPWYTEVTGSTGNVYTAQPVHDAYAVARHSFAQTFTLGTSAFGMHVSYLDRTLGDLASINPLYQFRTKLREGWQDDRVFPWLYPLENEVVVSFNIDVKTIRRLSGDSHAYGHPTLQFMDTASGQHLYVTLGTYGTGVSGRPGDLVGMDGTTGRVIVGTAFRDDPLFGKRLAGNFMHCDGNATQGGCETGGFFSFRITRDDFAKVLGHARTLNPQLSADPTRYLLANFHFNNEIYREAELGLSLSNYTLKVYGY